MKRLLARLESRAGKRWLCASLCTLLLVLTALFAPVWAVKKTAEGEASSEKTSISLVQVIKKRKPAPVSTPARQKKAPAKPLTAPEMPAVPTPTAEPETEEAPEEERAEAEAETQAEESEAQSGEPSAGEEAAEPELTAGEKKAMQSYKSYALSRIAGKKVYPYAARSKGIEGKVRLRVVISADGSLLSCELLTPSEHELLNEAALSAVQKAAPFKKMPKTAAPQKPLTLTFVMDFALE